MGTVKPIPVGTVFGRLKVIAIGELRTYGNRPTKYSTSQCLCEKAELDEKRTKLQAFRETETFKDLPLNERIRLVHQFDIMTEYSDVLGERIAAFQP